MSNELIPSKAQERQLLLRKNRDAERVVLCLDHSGSMASPMATGQIKSRQHATFEAALAITNASRPETTHYGLVAFESGARTLVEITDEYMEIQGLAALQPAGGTAMDQGISVSLQQTDGPPHRIILLSDGGADDRDAALNVTDTAVLLGVVIDTISIGDSDDALMQEIARRTGGKWQRCEDPLALAQAFMKLETRARAFLEYKG